MYLGAGDGACMVRYVLEVRMLLVGFVVCTTLSNVAKTRYNSDAT